MPYRPPTQCPTLDFLDEVERTFSVAWPKSFRTFCRLHAPSGAGDGCPTFKGTFIRDIETLEKANVLVGEGSWGDYEQAIAGRRHSKNGLCLYLDLMPFYVEKKDILGFLITDPGSDRVAVWSVHTLVNEYPPSTIGCPWRRHRV